MPVRDVEGTTHGFLVARRAHSGEIVAEGDLIETVRDGRIDSRLVFNFPDGSVHEETVVFSQNGVFSLDTYKLVERGPAFPVQTEIFAEREGKTSRGRYQLHSRHQNGTEDNSSGELDLPADVYNGMIVMLVRNLAPESRQTIHVLAFTPKPMLVELDLTPGGKETVQVGDRHISAMHYVLKPKLGVIRAAVAALIGKTPPDYHCWITRASPSAFVAIDGPLYTGGPIWHIEAVSPHMPVHPVARQ